MPELPDAKKARFISTLGITDYDANVLVAEREVADYYEAVVSASTAADTNQAAKLIANWLISEVFGALNREGITLEQVQFTKAQLAELVDLIMDGTISGKIAKDVFAKMWETGHDPKQLVASLGLQQISDTSVIEKAIEAVLASSPSQLAQYRAGKEQLFGYFVGQVMKALHGKANPGVVNDILKAKL
jgi:aspartyl-tRNA(Asn)/glutamyl-tRNA(Gln) amidotransferase subunit B